MKPGGVAQRCASFRAGLIAGITRFSIAGGFATQVF
jgi:hypothetical protein